MTHQTAYALIISMAKTASSTIIYPSKTNAAKAEYRARRVAQIDNIKQRINVNLMKLNRPTIDFSKKGPHSAMKGKARPNYDPTPEERAKMTSSKELMEWRATERKKRKAQAESKRRARQKEEHRMLKKMLIELDKEVMMMENKKTPGVGISIKDKAPIQIPDGDNKMPPAVTVSPKKELEAETKTVPSASVSAENTQSAEAEDAASALLFLSKA